MFNRLVEINKVQSFVPLCMKRFSTLDVKIDGSLNVKRYPQVIISCKARSNSTGKVKEGEQVSSNYVTIREANNLDTNVKLAKGPKIIEDGGASHS